MKILFLTIVYPENINDRNIYTDLMKEFKSRGHEVYVATSREKKHNKDTELNVENGINVLRVKTGNIQKVNKLEKAISTLTIENLYMKAIKKYFSNIKFDLVIYSTPPITFAKVVSYLKKSTNCKTYLLLKDIFPQNAVDLEMFKKNGLIYKYFRSKEVNLYNQSDYIGCMSKANVDYVIKHNDFIDINKVEECPNTITPLNYSKIDIDLNSIKIKYNIPLDRKLFIYGGNLGKPQGCDFLLEVLKSNKDNKKIHFVIVGSGTEFNKIKEFLSLQKITNVTLQSYLPKNDYDKLLLACDVGMIFLDKRFTIPNFPSRLLSYMELSMPIIAATDVNTDIGEVIVKGKFGLWSESEDLEKFNENLNMLLNDEDKIYSMGKHARKYLEEHYTSKHSEDIIMKHFKEGDGGSV